MSWLRRALDRFATRNTEPDEWIEALEDLSSGLAHYFEGVKPIELGVLDVDMQVMTGESKIADHEMYAAMKKVVLTAHESRMATVALLELSAKRADEREELPDGE